MANEVDGAGVLRKVFRILDVIRDNPAGLNLTAISKSARLNKATAYRLLSELERAGYLFRDGSRRYTVGLKLAQFSNPMNFESRLREAAHPALEALWKETHETVNLGVLHQETVLYVDVIQSPHIFRLASKIGMHRPVYCTALGKILMAFLPEEDCEELLKSLSFVAYTPRTITNVVSLRRELEITRGRAYAVDEQESVQGARCIGAPIFNPEGVAAAAISIAGPVTRIAANRIKTFAAAVTQVAQGISGRVYGVSK